MSVFDSLKSIFLFLTDKDIFPSILVFLASIIGIVRVTQELRFRSIMTGMTEKIERIHSKNDVLEEFCSKKMASLLEQDNPTNRFEELKVSDIRKTEALTKQLLAKSIGASRQLETYSLFLKYCLSKENLLDNENPTTTKHTVFNILIQGLEIIQKQALTIIESPKKIKLEKSSPIRPDLRIFTSSKGFNSTPNVEIGPSAKDSTDEALYFYGACLHRNAPFQTIKIFEAFFELIRGNHPFCVLMAAEKILPPAMICLEGSGFLKNDHVYHAINYRSELSLNSGTEYIEIIYANISRGIQLSLSNYTADKLLTALAFKGTKSDLRKADVERCTIIEDKYITLKFKKDILRKEFKRNRRALELYLLENSNKLTFLNQVKTYTLNFFRFKV